jgi:hypothetical protein
MCLEQHFRQDCLPWAFLTHVDIPLILGQPDGVTRRSLTLVFSGFIFLPSDRYCYRPRCGSRSTPQPPCHLFSETYTSSHNGDLPHLPFCFFVVGFHAVSDGSFNPQRLQRSYIGSADPAPFQKGRYSTCCQTVEPIPERPKGRFSPAPPEHGFTRVAYQGSLARRYVNFNRLNPFLDSAFYMPTPPSSRCRLAVSGFPPPQVFYPCGFRCP